MDKERLVNSFLEMVAIHSPSKKEGEFAKYLVEELKKLGAEIYLDEGYKNYGGDAPTVIGKIKGDLAGEGVTLAAHMDVIEPSKDVKATIVDGIIKTDGTTTLGGDDKGGIAAILEALKVLKEKNISHEDIFVVFTPCEESGMVGAKNVDWNLIPKDMLPAKNMIVLDNVGRAGIIAHTAPSKYDLEITFRGRKAHAGIEPEKGINAINVAALAISKMKMGRIDELTTSNIGVISSNFPINVVADECTLKSEIRSHSEEKILQVIEEYRACCQDAVSQMGGSFEMEYSCDYPTLKPKDDLKFAKEFAKVYEELGIETELKVIGGGSDSNIFANQGYNSIIIGFGMYDVHTVNETLEIEELCKTTRALINYISK